MLFAQWLTLISGALLVRMNRLLGTHDRVYGRERLSSCADGTMHFLSLARDPSQSSITRRRTTHAAPCPADLD